MQGLEAGENFDLALPLDFDPVSPSTFPSGYTDISIQNRGSEIEESSIHDPFRSEFRGTPVSQPVGLWLLPAWHPQLLQLPGWPTSQSNIPGPLIEPQGFLIDDYARNPLTGSELGCAPLPDWGSNQIPTLAVPKATSNVHNIDFASSSPSCLCGKTFSRKDALSRHIRSASLRSTRFTTETSGAREKNYACHLCDKFQGVNGFKRRDHLRQHLGVKGYHKLNKEAVDKYLDEYH
ncbi:hypothetical protein QBC34DRAFT_393624 [Podospora aff. communis PSN243]|uniref:C2H2-type domain-containing protein n=1 Tax=Podospora aff. communis PSN243 TaxID=3040156 RepID=A0AAV9H4I6_9PEZI|nr:hypothetical protein QBC34DRAFT_393624 [Podospora aff. communis PSN243]